MFYKNYNLFIYLKAIIITLKVLLKTLSKTIIIELNSLTFNNSNFKNDLLDIKKIKIK